MGVQIFGEGVGAAGIVDGVTRVGESARVRPLASAPTVYLRGLLLLLLLV